MDYKPERANIWTRNYECCNFNPKKQKVVAYNKVIGLECVILFIPQKISLRALILEGGVHANIHLYNINLDYY